MIGVWLFVLVAPSILDSLIRGILVSASRLPLDGVRYMPVGNWLVLIPARSEGRLVETTVASVRAVAGDRKVEILVVLDGADPIASEAARNLGAAVVVKHPAGPTKGALLRWVAENHRVTIDSADAVLLLDVGSALSPSFFQHFEWSTDSEGMQTLLRGEGEGPGQAAAVSEALAQGGEDQGRERLGWSVRLRGTGTALTPRAFLSLAPRLKTQVEDLEASLVLAADGARMRLASPKVFVVDEKPDRVRDAAVQRARWLAGKLEVFFRHSGSVYRLIARRPLEGVAFVCEMLGRPLSLTIPLRGVAAVWLLAEGFSSGAPWMMLLAAIAAASAIADISLLLRGGSSLRSAGRMGLAWGGALALSPRALVRWMRARR